MSQATLFEAKEQLLTSFTTGTEVAPIQSGYQCNERTQGKREFYAIFSEPAPADGDEQVVVSVVPAAGEQIVTLEGFYESDRDWTNFSEDTEQVEHDSVEAALEHVEEVLA